MSSTTPFSSSAIESASTAAAIIASSPTTSTSTESTEPTPESSSTSASTPSTLSTNNHELFRAYYRRVSRVIQAYLDDQLNSNSDSNPEIRWSGFSGAPKKRLDKSVPPNSVLTELALTDSIDSLFDRLFLFLDTNQEVLDSQIQDHYSNPAYLDHLALTLNCWWVIFYDVTRYSEFIVSTLGHTVNTLVRACSAQLRLFWTHYYDRMPGDEDGLSALELIVTTVGYLLENVLRSPQFNACELVTRDTLYELIKTVLPYQVIHVRICQNKQESTGKNDGDGLKSKHRFPFSFYLVDDLLMNILFEFDYHQYRYYLNQTDVLITMIRLMMDFAPWSTAPSSVSVGAHKDLYLELLTKYFQKAATPATESEHRIAKLELEDILAEINNFLDVYKDGLNTDSSSSKADSAALEAVKHFVKSLIDRKGPSVIWANFAQIKQDCDRQGLERIESLPLVKYLTTLGVPPPTPDELQKALDEAKQQKQQDTTTDIDELQRQTEQLKLSPRSSKKISPRVDLEKKRKQEEEDFEARTGERAMQELNLLQDPMFAQEDPIFAKLGHDSKEEIFQAVVKLQQNLIKSQDELKKIINNVLES